MPTLKMLEESGATAVICTVRRGSSQEVQNAAQQYSEFHIPDGVRFDEELFTLAVEDLERYLSDGHTVLVHCHAGRNRSCTVAALYLIRRGMEPDVVIDHIREIRPRAIANPVFEQRLLDGGI